MQSDLLLIYMNDHLALLVGELELVKRCHASNEGTALGDLLEDLAVDLQSERLILENLVADAGGSQDLVKQGAAWMSEKLGRLKLNGSLTEYSDLSRLIELETLELAAHGRATLWENLIAASQGDRRIPNIDLGKYRDQARLHSEALKAQRVKAAESALSKPRCPGNNVSAVRAAD